LNSALFYAQKTFFTEESLESALYFARERDLDHLREKKGFISFRVRGIGGRGLCLRYSLRWEKSRCARVEELKIDIKDWERGIFSSRHN